MKIHRVLLNPTCKVFLGRGVLIPAVFLALSACSGINVIGPAASPNIRSLPLSLSNGEFKTCLYDRHIRVAHFPMFHYPPTGYQGDQALLDQVSRSQFQLLHTILAYRANIAVFSESVLSDAYNVNTYSNLEQGIDRTTFEYSDGTGYSLQERYHTARNLFPQTVLQYYEHLNPGQRMFLFETGGALTAYLLGQIPQIYKTAAEEEANLAYNNLNRISCARYRCNLELLFNAREGADQELDYWRSHYREEQLSREVRQFYLQNPSFNGLILIAYGAAHKLQNEFQGYSFSDGSYCLSWWNQGVSSPALQTFY